jgi:hypothetical protein
MKKKHVHKYHKAHIYSVDTYSCALPDCTHYLPNGMQSLIIGRSSICWECSQQFILNPESIKLDKPTCDSCRLGITDEDDFLALLKKAK